MDITRILRDRLFSDIALRRICGWEPSRDIPSESTFSRAFAEFSQSQLPELIHEALIKEHLGNHIIGHVSRDSTAIVAREKPEPVQKKPKDEPPKKREQRRLKSQDIKQFTVKRRLD